jgi:hypothetical protein
MRVSTVLVTLSLAPLILGSGEVALAQETAEANRPEGWHVRTDRPNQDPADVDFTDMPPGWHVTTGPAAILWHPETTASGRFEVDMEVYLFDPRGRREAFGFFMGGQDLDGPNQEYVYFLLREGGEFLVKRRSGDGTEPIVDWSSAPSMKSWAARDEGEVSVRNVLAVQAGEETVRFLVNGEEVASLPRASLSLDGVVGLRVNHGLNVHVSRLDVEGGG